MGTNFMQKSLENLLYMDKLMQNPPNRIWIPGTDMYIPWRGNSEIVAESESDDDDDSSSFLE